MSNKAQ